MAGRKPGESGILSVERFLGAVDQNVPLFNRDTGILKKLSNMRVKPGGYLETRGGYEELKPSGGTAASIDSAGVIAGIYEHTQSHGCVLLDNAGTYSTDIAFMPGFRFFGPLNDFASTPPSVRPVLGNAVNFGSSATFSRLRVVLAQGTGGAYTVTWKYSLGGGSWGNLPAPAPTEDFKTSGTKDISWSVPTDWLPMQVNNIFLYWIRCEVTVNGAVGIDSIATSNPILSDWSGRRMLFGAATSGKDGPANGKLRFYAQNGAGAASWSDAFVGATTLFSGRDPRYRMTTFQNRLMFVNGLESKRYNNDRASDIGLPAPGGPLTHAAAAAANNYGTAAIYDFAISLGYGPNGEWGESPYLMSTTGPVAYAAGDQAQIAWPAGSGVPGQTDRVYVYRTDDLTNVPVSDRINAPMYRIAMLPQVVTGGTVPGLPVTYIDYSRQFPFPEVALDISSKTPPARCRFISSSPGRVLYASNDQYPARGWWSEIGAGETVNQDENYMDLSDVGGFITGSQWAFDTWFLWSELGMRGVADLDEDSPAPFDVPGGVGSIAPDAVAYRYGRLIWASGDGIYMMTKDGAINRISDDQSAVFQAMTVETHGRSRACMYRGMYDILLLDQKGAPVGSQPHWRYDLVTQNWHEVSHVLSPFIDARAPLGHADQGVSHPFFGNQNPLVADRKPYLGEYTTVDAGAGFDCIADIHFGPAGFVKFSPRRFAAYYQADAGWGSPVISTPPGASYIFSTPPGFGTPTPKTGTDYRLVVSNANTKQSGSQDIAIRFKATTAAGGTMYGQRLLAAYLDGEYASVHPTS